MDELMTRLTSRSCSWRAQVGSVESYNYGSFKQDASPASRLLPGSSWQGGPGLVTCDGTSHPRAPGVAAEPQPPGPLALHLPVHQDALGGVTPKIVTLWGHGMKQQCVLGAECNALGPVGSFEKPRVPVGKLEASPAVALLCP